MLTAWVCKIANRGLNLLTYRTKQSNIRQAIKQERSSAMSLVRCLALTQRLVRVVTAQTVQTCLQRSPVTPHTHVIPSTGSWLQTRSYAKKAKKDKGGGKGSSKKSMTLTEEELDGLLDKTVLEAEMQHVLDDLKQQYIHQLSLRTSSGVFDNLMVTTDDGRFPLIQLGQIVQKSPQLLLINMAASPQYLPAVKTAITQSGMNVNPQQDGTTLFVPLPKVTKEHRENLAKSAKQLCDKVKVKLRDIHAKHVKKVKASKEGHSEDLLRNVQDMVLDRMHEYSTRADAMMHAKQTELLGNK